MDKKPAEKVYVLLIADLDLRIVMFINDYKPWITTTSHRCFIFIPLI